jgi:hypothetical protein
VSLRSIIRTIRLARASQPLVRRWSMSDLIGAATLLISVLSLLIAIGAARIAVVGMKHADQSGDETISELKKQVVQLDKSRELLDSSSVSLKGLLTQADRQVELSSQTIEQLKTQLKVSQMQTQLSTQHIAVSKEQMRALEDEFSRRPNISAQLGCRGMMAPGDFGLRDAPEQQYSSDDPREHTNKFELNLYQESGNLRCRVTLSNNGTINAQGVSVDAELSNLGGPNQPFLFQRYPGAVRGGPENPPFRAISIHQNGTSSSAMTGNLQIAQGIQLLQHRYDDVVVSRDFSVEVDPTINTFNLELRISGDNFPTKKVSVMIVLRRVTTP